MFSIHVDNTDEKPLGQLPLCDSLVTRPCPRRNGTTIGVIWQRSPWGANSGDDRDGDRPNTSRGIDLPHDIPGRFASILAGLFFSICGVTALVGLLENGFRMAVFGFYELSVASDVFGIALVLWGLAKPTWVGALLNGVVIHATLVFGVLFFPFVIEFLMILARGN